MHLKNKLFDNPTQNEIYFNIKEDEFNKTKIN